MTWSIVAREAETGAYGVAVASRFFAVGSLIPHVRGDAAVATQAFVNPVWGLEAADRLTAGENSKTIVADLAARDEGRAHRQIHMVDKEGIAAAYTGEACVGWCGHITGPGVSVAGNMLTGEAVLRDTMTAFKSNAHLPFAERLLAAMDAGQAAGGDKRGRQSAALRIHRNEDYPWIDLRADDHPGPLAELRRLLDVAGEHYLHFAEALPTKERLSGDTDQERIQNAIRSEATRRRAEGRASRSFAN